MTKTLKIQFDPNQDYQLEAVNSIVDLFDGLPPQSIEFALGEDIVPNIPEEEYLPEEDLADNLAVIQEQYGIRPSPGVQWDDGLGLQGIEDTSHRYPHFTIEMETGTGKTYVYLRSIYELRRRFGFTKFVIVVPSIAIFKGVVKTFDITRDHFAALYGNEPVHLVQYDGSQLSRLRSFATSTFTEVLLITIDSFNKKTNNIYKASEKLPGERLPYQFVQETRPILILDEPQNMESARSREALRTLHPLFALRFSATHRSNPNPVYQLTPFEAFRRNLVKKIQVLGITQQNNANERFLALQQIVAGPPITATVTAFVDKGGLLGEEHVTLRHGDDLFSKTHLDEHRDGYKVQQIHAGERFLEFANGIRLHLDETIGPSRPAIFTQQIEETITHHIELSERLASRGIKVLSLFFVDRVANFRDDNGIIKCLFDETFDRLKVGHPAFASLEANQVRAAYFAQAKTKSGDLQDIDTSSKNDQERAAEKAAFQLIMRDKERLLSLDEPVQFIFAHSALKEGWDNPNVFQICTLKQTISEVSRRQEIGRGLRICVNQDGLRVFGDDVNVLTVVANESYSSYAAGLQSDYVKDNQQAPPKPTDARRTPATRNDAIFRSTDFAHFWDKFSRHLQYHVHIDTPALIQEAVEKLNNTPIPDPSIVIQKGGFVITRFTITVESVTSDRARITVARQDTDDDITSLTRTCRVGDTLADALDDERLRDYRILELVPSGADPCVRFAARDLPVGLPFTWEVEIGQRFSTRVTTAPTGPRYGVSNLIARASRETRLTRPTVNAIFRGISDRQKQKILTNPEGFAGVFITTLRNVVADHIAARVAFTLDSGSSPVNLERLFPEQVSFPQKELVAGNDHSLYHQVQTDSEVENRFVERLNADPNVLFFFKFPSTFRVSLPKIIGNYNPDWGIGRLDDSGEIVLDLVRETKGAIDTGKLRFPHERRKITGAQRHFETLGIDYRHITDKTPEWWRPAADAGVQQVLSETRSTT